MLFVLKIINIKYNNKSSPINQQFQMSKQSFRILEKQILKFRIEQNLDQQIINQLVEQLETVEIERIIKVILTHKNPNKRTYIDNYILMKCCQIYQYFNFVLINKGQKPLMQVCKHLYYSKVLKQKYVFKIGEPSDKIYIIMKGQVVAHVIYKEKVIDENGNDIIQQKIKQATKFTKGMVFGDPSSKESNKYAVSIFTVQQCEFFQIKKKDYQLINKYVVASIMRQRYLFFQSIQLFTKLNKNNLETLTYLIQIKVININHVLYRENDQIDYVYIIKSGEFKIERDIVKITSIDDMQKLKTSKSFHKKVETAILGQKQVLGDIELFKNKNREDTCICITQIAQVFRIRKKDFILKFFEEQNDDQMGLIECITKKDQFKYQRVKDLQNSYYKNRLLSNISATPEKKKRLKIDDIDFEIKKINSNVMSRVCNRQYDQDLHKKKKTLIFAQKKTIFRSEKNKFSEKNQTKYIPFAYRFVSNIVNQKKKYSSMKHYDNEPLFKFMQLPRYFKLKMQTYIKQNLKQSKSTKTQGEDSQIYFRKEVKSVDKLRLDSPKQDSLKQISKKNSNQSNAKKIFS